MPLKEGQKFDGPLIQATDAVFTIGDQREQMARAETTRNKTRELEIRWMEEEAGSVRGWSCYFFPCRARPGK